MNQPLVKRMFGILASIAVITVSSAGAQTVKSVSTFASGTAVNATGPDSVALTESSVWVSYTNGAESHGKSGSSTVVRYRLNGTVRKTYSFAGSVDGLKIDPRTGLVWALQNQDGNTALTLIDPKTEKTTNVAFEETSPTRGYDDVVFRLNDVS